MYMPAYSVGQTGHEYGGEFQMELMQFPVVFDGSRVPDELLRKSNMNDFGSEMMGCPTKVDETKCSVRGHRDHCC